MSDLPRGWSNATLEDITLINPRHSTSLDSSLKISFVPMPGVSDRSWKFNFAETRSLGEVRNGFTHFAEGDVLIGKITPSMENGKAAVANGLTNGLGCGTTELHVLRPKASIESKYIYYFIHQESFRREAAQNMTGTAGQLRVPVDFIRKALISLPPLNEQRRIVAKLEKLLSKVDTCKERLEKIPNTLKRFRQSVLAAACSGRLTADWREKNPDVEPANKLLEQIKARRLTMAKTDREQKQIAKFYEEATNRLYDKDIDFDLPETWLLCEIGDIGNVCNGSTPSRKCLEYWGGKIPWVSSGEVYNNIITKTRETITSKGYDNSSVRILPIGTVLLAMIGEGKTRGQTAILRIEATINQNIAAVILDHSLMSSEYLWYWFQYQYESTRKVGSGSGPQALNCQRVREMPFVLQPFPEQQEIVRRVEALFKVADEIEGRYKKAKAYVDKLTQSILAKAFRGELVPQDPKDEPAAALLERIREERSKNQVNSQRKKIGARKQKRRQSQKQLRMDI